MGSGNWQSCSRYRFLLLMNFHPSSAPSWLMSRRVCKVLWLSRLRISYSSFDKVVSRWSTRRRQLMQPKAPASNGSLATLKSRQGFPIFMLLAVTPCSLLVSSFHRQITAESIDSPRIRQAEMAVLPDVQWFVKRKLVLGSGADAGASCKADLRTCRRQLRRSCDTKERG